MRKYLLSFLFVFGIFVFMFQSQSVFAKTKKVVLREPHNGETVNIVNEETMEWWENNNKVSWNKFNKKKKDIAKTKKVIFRWKKMKGYQTYVFELGLGPSFLRCPPRIKKEIKGTSISVDNLLRNTKYYWRVQAKKQRRLGYELHSSKTYSFTTSDTARILSVSKVVNMRDLGGYDTGDGNRVKQGVLFRSANFDKIDEKGKETLKNELKIKTDLDLRKDGDGKLGEKYSPLENYIHQRGSNYMGIFDEGEAQKRFIDGVRVLANSDNYPIVFHCIHGRDRTGTLAFIINGLLGVSEEDLKKDFEMTFLSSEAGNEISERISYYNKMLNAMKKYKDPSKSLSCNIEEYLLDNGITEKEIKNIKTVLIETPEDRIH